MQIAGNIVICFASLKTVEQIMETVSKAYEQRADLKTLIDSGMKKAEKKLLAYEAVLRTCLTEVIQARP